MLSKFEALCRRLGPIPGPNGCKRVACAAGSAAATPMRTSARNPLVPAMSRQMRVSQCRVRKRLVAETTDSLVPRRLKPFGGVRWWMGYEAVRLVGASRRNGRSSVRLSIHQRMPDARAGAAQEAAPAGVSSGTGESSHSRACANNDRCWICVPISLPGGG
jgi:hypothetical protein